MHRHTHAHMRTHFHTYTRTHTSTHTDTHASMPTFTHTRTFTHTHTPARTRTHALACTRTHTFTHASALAHSHTQSHPASHSHTQSRTATQSHTHPHAYRLAQIHTYTHMYTYTSTLPYTPLDTFTQPYSPDNGEPRNPHSTTTHPSPHSTTTCVDNANTNDDHQSSHGVSGTADTHTLTPICFCFPVTERFMRRQIIKGSIVHTHSQMTIHKQQKFLHFLHWYGSFESALFESYVCTRFCPKYQKKIEHFV
jgi:hypothetical protein